MHFHHLTQDLNVLARCGGVGGQWVKGIAFDSRQVEPGYVFVATKGTTVDGHNYIGQAVEAGATAVVAEQEPSELALPEAVVYLQVSDSQEALGLLASRWYDQPSHNLKLLGITGTNGKTTVATLLHDLLQDWATKRGCSLR